MKLGLQIKPALCQFAAILVGPITKLGMLRRARDLFCDANKPQKAFSLTDFKYFRQYFYVTPIIVQLKLSLASYDFGT